ncbi:MBOAT family O-acyltransferase [Winogradskyella sp.]|uniref:MBOAT family O-acyltransferase n=1 Tax=Winogradskyella sp. TaxID=1883156 RepID=UPI0026322009|nr:MBOAT family O-acyltransferase [Winogradskyella sp.]
MLFNSWEFIGLFISTCLLYFNLPYKYRSSLLLISSYIFYISWRWDFAFVMLGVTLVNYYGGLKINESKTIKKKRNYLWLSIVLSLIPLLYLKYANFFIGNINNVSEIFDSQSRLTLLEVILPVGISFFTFQALSYSLDVYFGKTKVEHNVVNFAVFVAFFPQLVAGPIERSSNLLGQFREKHNFNRHDFIEGSKLFIWGLFKKVVIADRLAIYVDRIYENPDVYNGPTLAVATLFFAIQIYCDFSGYSDMAIGTAKILGFNLMQNFNLPYLSRSIAEFWRRWHISLSTWFSDYLYKPLGGNRVVYSRWLLNIFIVFLVSGFWHGANWTFIIWGFLHALYYVIESWGDKVLNWAKQTRIKQFNGYRISKMIVVFILVCYAWIFFRASSISDAYIISNKLIFDWSGNLYLGASTVSFVLCILLIIVLVFVQILQYNKVVSLYFSKSKIHSIGQLLWYVFLLLSVSMLGVSSNAFIYFQF